VLTGGEPMIAAGIVDLSQQLRERGLHITVETAGTVFTEVACDLMSISPKLSNSTPEGAFQAHHEKLRLQPGVLQRLMREYDYQLKFVIAREQDVDEARDVIANLAAPAEKVILMAEGVSAGILHERGLWLAELCKQHGYRFSPRLHVDLYGNKRGV
jgi:7-carboxy-7-deazaguanine synthase